MSGFPAAMALAMAALLLATFAVAIRPWWHRPAANVRRRQANVAAYRSRLVELDAEFAAGAIASEDAMQVLKQEAAARLLVDAGDLESEAKDPARNRVRPKVWTIGLLAILLTVFAFGGYWLAGSWRAQQRIAEARRSGDEIAGMVQNLAQKLAAQPDSPEGWALLGRSYFAMQHFDEAAKAYAQASAHGASAAADLRAEWLTNQGEALAFVDDREISPAAAQLFDQALALDPDEGKALWYAGLSASFAGDAARARMLWSRLAKQDLPAAMREALEQRLAQLPTQVPGTSDSASGTATAGGSGAQAAGSAVPRTSLHLHISLAPGLAEKIPADAKLLVFAKAEKGPPMPLAVKRLTSPQLPVDLTLDDSQAMTPALKLSLFDSYVVTARLSSGGMAQATAGDLQGSIRAVRADAVKTLQLTIDSVVP